MTPSTSELDRLRGELASRDARIEELTREVERLGTALVAQQDVSEALRQSVGQHIHRGKNLLSIMQSIAHRTINEGRSAGEARDALTGRLRCLARAYQLVTTAEGRGTDVGEVIDTQLSDVSDRVTAKGPPARLIASAVQTFALVIHELASNAMKHGALRSREGGVAVGWTFFELGAERYLEVAWTERGGAPPRAPSQYGFGPDAGLVLRGDRWAGADRAFDEAGLDCRLRLSQDLILAS